MIVFFFLKTDMSVFVNEAFFICVFKSLRFAIEMVELLITDLKRL